MPKYQTLKSRGPSPHIQSTAWQHMSASCERDKLVYSFPLWSRSMNLQKLYVKSPRCQQLSVGSLHPLYSPKGQPQKVKNPEGSVPAPSFPSPSLSQKHHLLLAFTQFQQKVAHFNFPRKLALTNEAQPQCRVTLESLPILPNWLSNGVSWETHCLTWDWNENPKSHPW